MDPKLGTDFDNGTKGNRLGDFEVGQKILILFCLDRRGRKYNIGGRPMIMSKLTKYS